MALGPFVSDHGDEITLEQKNTFLQLSSSTVEQGSCRHRCSSDSVLSLSEWSRASTAATQRSDAERSDDEATVAERSGKVVWSGDEVAGATQAPPGQWCAPAGACAAQLPARSSSTEPSPPSTPQARTHDDEVPSLFATETRTTVMLRHLPQELSRDQLVALLENAGFKGKFDFLYLPRHFAHAGNLGYAFVNVSSPDVLPGFWAALNGFRKWPVVWKRPCKVSWSVPFQGLEEHVQRYRNSCLLHASVPDEIRPILLKDGARIDFPPPTRALRAPRVRGSKGQASLLN